ncbi:MULTISPECIES: hypothetical protein [Metallibacterium]|jgi:hypothetical protein|uniref:hypothetical protein n=1 Tax=Metallibacterium TaxID=1218803 RepID=UPI00260486BB|nr:MULTISPECIES: hypothetical protein [Metallibacterium]MBW8075083.1 hypothetical protein [Metallibacterium scheffleri]
MLFLYLDGFDRRHAPDARGPRVCPVLVPRVTPAPQSERPRPMLCWTPAAVGRLHTLWSRTS